MPAPSLFDKRAEMTPRTLVRQMSPAASGASSSPRIHRGLMYADGTPLKGGRAHVASTPSAKHNILNPPPAPADGTYTEPTAFLPGGQAVVLGRRGSLGLSRSSSPATSVLGASHVTGKRHVSPSTCLRDSPLRHDCTPRSQTPTPRIHRVPTPGPRDHAIVGVCGPQLDMSQPPPRDTPIRGARHLTGCPAFVPPPFEKRPYTPQTKRVVSRHADNDIFNLAPGGQQDGTRTPPQSSTPRRLTIGVTTPASGIGSGILRGGVKDLSVTPARSPCPAPYATDGQIRTSTPLRGVSTPRRAQSPGSSHYNIITGQPL